MNDLISRQAAIEVIDAVFPVDPTKSEYAQGIAVGAALAKTYVEQLPSAQPELIEKTAYIRGFEQGRTQGMIDTKAEEVAQSTADVVEVVRCKDCKKYNTDDCMMIHGKKMNRNIFANDYCSYGEKA